jgi:hypothetical protein
MGNPSDAGAGVRAGEPMNEKQDPISYLPIRREIVVQNERITIRQGDVMQHGNDVPLDGRRKHGRHGLCVAIAEPGRRLKGGEALEVEHHCCKLARQDASADAWLGMSVF